MKDEELLKALGRAAREADEADAQYRALATGEISAAERAELEAIAAGDPAAERALDAYRPFDSAELDRMAAAISTPAAPRTVAAVGPQAAASPAAKKSARVLVLFGAPLAAAAAVLLYLARPARPDLPPYEIGFASAVKTERAHGPSDLVPEARLDAHGTFEMVVRPSEPVTTPVAARAVLVRGGHAVAIRAPLEVSPEGSVRLAGPAASLFPEARGAYDVVVAVAAPGALPSDAELARIAEQNAPASGIRVARGHVVFVE